MNDSSQSNIREIANQRATFWSRFWLIKDVGRELLPITMQISCETKKGVRNLKCLGKESGMQGLISRPLLRKTKRKRSKACVFSWF